MTFLELDAEIRLMISNTVQNCGGTPDPSTIDGCATGIEALACGNMAALEEQIDHQAAVAQLGRALDS